MKRAVRRAEGILRSRRGSEMVEASIAMPVIILLVFLLLRMFTFYLEILNGGVKEHEKALEEWKNADKPTISVYRNKRTVSLLGGGLLLRTVSRDIDTELFMYSEDSIVRTGEMIENKQGDQ